MLGCIFPPSISDILQGSEAIFSLSGYKSLLWRSRPRSRLAAESILWGRREVAHRMTRSLPLQSNLYEICRWV